MILDFPTIYNNSVTYYGIGFFWTDNGGSSGVIPPVGGVGKYKTLLGVGV